MNQLLHLIFSMKFCIMKMTDVCIMHLLFFSGTLLTSEHSLHLIRVTNLIFFGVDWKVLLGGDPHFFVLIDLQFTSYYVLTKLLRCWPIGRWCNWAIMIKQIHLDPGINYLGKRPPLNKGHRDTSYPYSSRGVLMLLIFYAPSVLAFWTWSPSWGLRKSS